MSDPSTKTSGSLPMGTRVRHISDARLLGVIEEYEFPGMLGRVFVRANDGSGFWFHHFQLVKDVIHCETTASHLPPGIYCKGAYALGSACGRCDRCDQQRRELGIPDGWIGRWPAPTNHDRAASLRYSANDRRKEAGRLEAIILETLAEAARMDAEAAKLEAESNG